MKTKASLLLVFFLCFLKGNYFLAVVYSTVSSGSWTDGTKWSGGVAPPSPLGAANSIIVNHAMTLSVARTFNGNVSVNAAITCNQNISITGATVTFGVGGRFNSTMDVAITAGILEIEGVVNSATISLSGNGYIFNKSSGTLTTTGNFTSTGSSYFRNEGDMNIGGGLDINKGEPIVNTIVNTGFLTVDGLLNIKKGVDMINSGVIQAEDIDIDKNNSINNTGVLYAVDDFSIKKDGDISGVGFIFAGGDVSINTSTDSSTQNICRPDGITVPTLPPGSANQAQLTAATNSFCGTPLPVGLISFELSNFQDSKHVKLVWKTASERMSDYFMVEVSKDALYWEEIGRVDGAGTTSIENTYSLVDENPLVGLSYYRLSQTDINGNRKYFDILPYNYSSNEFLVYPIPANNYIVVESSDLNNFEFEIIDLNGQVVTAQFQMLGKDKLLFNTLNFLKGVYFIRFKSSNETIIKRVMIVH